MSRKTTDTLPVPVKLVINHVDGLNTVNLEHYTDKEKLWTALECLFSKQAMLESLLIRFAWDPIANPPEKLITSIYAVVRRGWDGAKFTEKRYRGKIKTLDDLNWLEAKLNLTTLAEFKELLQAVYPSRFPTTDTTSEEEPSLGYRVAHKLNKF